MAILPEYQDKGLGTKLLKKVITFAKKLKLKSIYLRTSKAKDFYEKHKFQKVKHIERKKDNYDILELKLRESSKQIKS